MSDLGAEPPLIAEIDTAPTEAAPTGRLIPMIIGSALFMQTLDSTVVTNALPSMARSLHENPLTLNLTITAYLLTSAVFLPISGWAADSFGAKRVFRIAIGLFAFASLLCGLSQTLPELISARLLQGVAGAMMAPVGRLVLLKSVPRRELVRAMTYLTMPAMLGPVLGPPIGGLIVTYLSWRWIFFINIPVAVFGVVLIGLFIPDIREAGRKPLDWRGFLLTGTGLAGVMFGLQNIGHGVLPPAAIAALFGVGGLCLGLYGRHAARIAHPIIDLSIFHLPTFTSSAAGGAFLRFTMGATPFLLALLLQVGFGMGPLAAGLITFTSAAGALLMKTTARPILARLGFKRVLVGNTALTGLIFMSYSLFRSDTPHGVMIAALLIGGFFRSLQFTALNALAFAEVEPPRMSGASTLSSMTTALAQSVGVAIAAVLLFTLQAAHGSTVLRAADVSPAFVIMGALSMAGLWFFVRLPANAGAELSGKR